MAVTKEEAVLEFLNNTYNEYNIDPRENLITVSFDFIINTGNAKATDIEDLILHVQKTVKNKFQIELQTEVQIVGFAK